MDIAYLLEVQQFREVTGGIFNSFFQFMTDVGWSIIPFLVMAGMYWCIDKKSGLYMITNSYIGAWVNGILKLTACIYRPWIRSSEIKPLESAMKTATGYSFPSGHMANGVAVWGGLAVSYKKDKWLRYALIVLIILIGFSRNYVGVHTPQDVLVSGCIGVLLLYLTYKMMRWVDKDPKRDQWILIGSIVMCITMILYASLKQYPVDYVAGKILVDPQKMALDSWASGGEILGFGIGFYCERKWVQFKVDGSVSERIRRFVIGSMIFAFIFYALVEILGLCLPTNIAYFVTKMIAALYIVLIFPIFIAKQSTPQPTDPIDPALNYLPEGDIDWDEISAFVEDMLGSENHCTKGWNIINDPSQTDKLKANSLAVLHTLYDDLYNYFYKQNSDRFEVWRRMEQVVHTKYSGLSDKAKSKIIATYHIDDR